MNNIGQRIKELRKKNDLTQEKLADFLGVTYKAVSKWECGITVPDLALIVPLAKLLHVTTDELLGMTKPDDDSRKAGYDELYEKAHYPEQLETAAKAVAEYPGELKYMLWQADCLFMLAYDDYKDQDSFYTDLEKPLKLYMTVFENTDDAELKRSAVADIVMTLSALRRNEEAKKYAEMYPDAPKLSKETVMGWALTGDEKTVQRQKQLMHHLDDMLYILTGSMSQDDPNLHDLTYLHCAEQLIRTMIPDGNFLQYYDELMLISIYKAQILQYTEPQKAMEELREARHCASEFDRLFMEKPAAHPYTSPYFNMLDFNSADLLVYGPPEENKRMDHFRWWLSGACFDPLRERDDFRSLADEAK